MDPQAGTNPPAGGVTTGAIVTDISGSVADTSRSAHLGGPEVIAAVETATAILTSDPTKFKTAKGVILEIRKVQRLVIVEAGKRIKMPEVPQVWLEDKQRFEPNPLDPVFIEAFQDARYRQGMVTVNVSLALGTTVYFLPTGMPNFDDEEWSKELEDFELEIPKFGRMRYIAWLKYCALDDEEITELTKRIMQGAGITFQEDVAAATASFPSDETRNPNNGTGPT